MARAPVKASLQAAIAAAGLAKAYGQSMFLVWGWFAMVLSDDNLNKIACGARAGALSNDAAAGSPQGPSEQNHGALRSVR
jgi:hypothetical protein